MRVIGTAGHVDHGKSTLVERLTGIHPDRLEEEKTREMTIVLGFAWFNLPNGEEIGIVDVPGHRDFIENMLSGVGAIDSTILVVAADEGVMPQTREHLAILDLLQIAGGVVVLSKVDLIDDPDWLALVESDLRDTLQGTVLESAPIVRVSAKTGEGIPELQQLLVENLTNKPPRPDLGRPRLAVDRVFTISGFGTIVTGTLIDGQFEVGRDVSVLPQKLRGRIRGLQTHKRKEQIAVPGSRTAVNISGIDVTQINRGDVIAYPGDYQATKRLDVQFRLLHDVTQPLYHNTEVKLFVGASEVMARIRLLGTDLLKPGEVGWLQLDLNLPVVGIRGDHYILRRPSPGETIGGGIILDPQPESRHRRFDPAVIDKLKALVRGTPEDILFQASVSLGFAPLRDVIARSRLDMDTAIMASDQLQRSHKLKVLNSRSETLAIDCIVTSNHQWEQLTVDAKKIIADYCHLNPLRPGMPREELKSRLNVSSTVFNGLVDSWLVADVVEETSVRQNLPGNSPIPVIRTKGHKVEFSQGEKNLIVLLLNRFAASPFSPPTIKDAISEVGEGLYNAMIDHGYLIPITNEIVFRVEDYENFTAEIIAMINSQGSISVAQVRDRFRTSRRYALAILEHMDMIGVTVRSEDVRTLKQKL